MLGSYFNSSFPTTTDPQGRIWFLNWFWITDGAINFKIFARKRNWRILDQHHFDYLYTFFQHFNSGRCLQEVKPMGFKFSPVSASTQAKLYPSSASDIKRRDHFS